MIAGLNDWSVTEKAAFLATSLKGSAVNVLGGMDSTMRHSYCSLVTALETTFGTTGQRELNRVKLRRRRRHKETTDDVLVPGKTTLSPQDGNRQSNLRGNSRRRRVVGQAYFHERLQENGINLYDIVTEFPHVHMIDIDIDLCILLSWRWERGNQSPQQINIFTVIVDGGVLLYTWVSSPAPQSPKQFREPVMADWWKSSMPNILGIGAATITAGAALYMATRPQPFETPLDLTNQSQEVPGMPSARMSRYCKDGKLVEYFYEDVRTFYDGFRRGARVSDNGKCLGWKPSKTEPYKWLTYNQVLERAEFIGSGFIYKGIQASNTSRIGIYCKNRPEYVITDLACATYSMVLVPLYDTLGPDTCTFIINQTTINLVVCDTTERVTTLLEHKSETPDLKIIVCFEPLTSELRQLAADANVEIITFDDLEPSVPSDLCVICYTSGTTGLPKGAMITHHNLVVAMFGAAVNVASLRFSPDDVYFSYLPMAHVYEKSNQAFLFSQGCQIGFYHGDLRALTDDLKELQPTIFATVPRLLNRVYDKVTVTRQISCDFKTSCFGGIAVVTPPGGYNTSWNIIRKNSIWDTLIFRKVQESLGGRIRVVFSGSAPLSPHVINFTRVALGCLVIEGYGQTESTGTITGQVLGDSGTGYVGPPSPTSMVKLVDVPQMDYYAKNQQGEVCVKGANVFVGYLNEPEKTAEALDSDGWLHTGDIGMWLPNGALKIIDRKKNIFKLAQLAEGDVGQLLSANDVFGFTEERP
ncbi:Long-chain-fatty-acid--CoA ligase 5 [Lamellibrachia satsuma]|nr:Long-chain-fatty-acid--CoA ligase 5 [Lamellibrachia satsuma]